MTAKDPGETALEPPHARRRAMITLALIIVAGLTVRLVAVAHYRLWYDEAITLAIGHWPAWDFLVRPIDPSPALYYWVTKYWVGDQASVALVRLPAVLFGVAAIPVAYWLARQGLGRRSALVAAGLVALSPYLVDYSQEARPYSLLVLLVLGSAAGLARSLDRLRGGAPAGAMLALFWLAGWLAWLTHVTAIFWLGPAWLAMMVAGERWGSGRGRWAVRGAALLFVLACLPEAARIVANHRIKLDTFDWLVNLPPLPFLLEWGQLVLPTALWGEAWSSGVIASFVVFMMLVGLAAWGLRTRRAAIRAQFSDRPGPIVAGAILLVVPLLVWLFGFVVSPILMKRTLLLGIPGAMLLVALLDQLFPRWWIGPAALALFALNLAIGGTARPKPAWDQVAALIEREARPGDAVVLCYRIHAAPLMHALGGLAGPRRAATDLYTAYPGYLLKLEAPSYRGDWVRPYFDTVFHDDVTSFMTKHDVPRRPAMTTISGRIWLVETSCGLAAEIDRWIGPGRRTARLRFGQAVDFTPIKVDLVETAPRPRPVRLPNPLTSWGQDLVK